MARYSKITLVTRRAGSGSVALAWPGWECGDQSVTMIIDDAFRRAAASFVLLFLCSVVMVRAVKSRLVSRRLSAGDSEHLQLRASSPSGPPMHAAALGPPASQNEPLQDPEWATQANDGTHCTGGRPALVTNKPFYDMRMRHAACGMRHAACDASAQAQ
jgi:hypothetical protein